MDNTTQSNADKHQVDHSPALEISILELLEDDFLEKESTVYKETVLLISRVTPDDFIKKEQIDSLAKEIADPFFYGVIEASIGKCFYFLPIKVDGNSYLLKEAEPEQSKFLVRYQRRRIDIKIRAFGSWKLIKKDEPVSEKRYFGINKKVSQSGKHDKLCFIILDIIGFPAILKANK